MTSFPAALRRMAQQYDAAVAQVMAAWEPSCGCYLTGDRKSGSVCPEVKIFEAKIRDAIRSGAIRGNRE